MSTDLETQLARYGRYHRSKQRPVEAAEAMLPYRAPANLRPTRVPPGRRGRWAWAVVGAIVIAALVGGIALFGRGPQQEVIEQTTTTVFLPAPADPGGVLEPGSWSIAATFAQRPSAEQLGVRVEELRSWAGVLEAAAVADPAGWLALTGLDAGDCTPDAARPPCGVGLVALVTWSEIPLTNLRLETEFGMTAIAASDVPGPFMEGYLTAAQSQNGRTGLEFDLAPLGVEQPLTGPIANVSGDECDECEIVVQTDVDGFVFVTGLDLDGDPEVGVIHEVSGGGGTGVEVEDILIDGSRHGGAIANFQAEVGGRAVYGFAFLPLDSAVITFELADGRRVWQRPISGMALFVDGPGTARSDGDGGARATSPFVILEASGSEIMHIRGTPDGAQITDLRIDPTFAGATRGEPTR